MTGFQANMNDLAVKPIANFIGNGYKEVKKTKSEENNRGNKILSLILRNKENQNQSKQMIPNNYLEDIWL